MAISAAIGVGKKIVGKAISAAKKKKKDLETKGRRVKGLEAKKFRKEKITRKSLEKGFDNLDTPDVVAGAKATAQQATKKAIKGAKKVTAKAQEKTSKLIEGTTLGKAIGKNPTRAAELGGAALLTGALAQSVIKSTAKPEQEYTQKRLSDGRISTTYGGKNGNAVFSEKLLTQKEVDEVRTQLAILESIVLSDNPRKQRDEFINTVLLLNKKYGINNITGKNLSIIMPSVKKGEMKKLNVAQSGNMSKNFFG